MENYAEVPNIITGKDLDYLSDMFNWNYGAIKSTASMINSVQNSEAKELLTRVFNHYIDNVHAIMNLLKEGSNE